MIERTVTEIGGKVKSSPRGTVVAKWVKSFGDFSGKYTFYIGNGVVRVIHPAVRQELPPRIKYPRRPKYDEKAWGKFVNKLLELYPNGEFGLEIGDLHIISARLLTDGIETVLYSSSSHVPSLGKALLGDALFGTPGAIAGAASGKTYTRSVMSQRFSDSVLAQVRYSNGLLLEGEIKKKSPVYNTLMVNLTPNGF
jgi:hypothetical protein